MTPLPRVHPLLRQADGRSGQTSPTIKPQILKVGIYKYKFIKYVDYFIQ